MALIPARAHYPHDVHEFITLSPEFSIDGNVFVGQHLGKTARPMLPFVSRDRGNSWEFHPRGVDNLGLFRSATVSPRYAIDNTVFMTDDISGLYRSTDRGRSWTQANQGLPTRSLYRSAAAVDANGRVVLLVSGVSGGLYRSADSGASWTTVISPNVLVEVLTMSPDFNLDATVVAGNSSGALLVSVDGGITFSQRDVLAAAGPIVQIEFTPGYAASGEIYVGTASGLYFSDSAAQSFSRVDGFGSVWVAALAISPDYRNDRTLFAATPTQGVFKSTDAGQNWTLHETGKGLSTQSNYHFLDLEVSDDFAEDGVVFLAAFEGLFRSKDGGVTWVELETRPPTMIMDLALSPNLARDGVMLVATYGGGLYVSKDAGASWNVSNQGVLVTTLNDVEAVHSAGEEPILFAAHAGYLLQSVDGGATWSSKLASGENFCNPNVMRPSPAFADDRTIFLGCREDGFKVSRDGGDTWQTLFTTEQLANGRILSIAVSPDFATDATVFIAHWGGTFLRSRDGGNSWERVVDGLPGPWSRYGGTSIDVSPGFSTDNFLVASTPRGFYRSLDAGDNWSPTPDVTSPVASGIIEYAKISPDFELDRTILASVRGKGLFRSRDAGLTWQRVAVDSFESGYEVKVFAFSPDFAQDGVIIGFGGEHLLRSTDRGDTFEPFDIPFVRHEENRSQTITYFGDWNRFFNQQASALEIRAARGGWKQVALNFRGTGVSWIGMRADMLGIAHVYLDGRRVAVVDQYHPTLRWRESLFSINGLPLGPHRLHIIATNGRNPASSGTWTAVDAFDVTR